MQIFADPCKNRKRKLNDVQKMFYTAHCAVKKLYKIFAVRFLCPTLDYPSKNTVFELLQVHLQNPYFYCFANVPKMPYDIEKIKNKGQLLNQYYQISFKNCKTFAKNLFKKLISPKIGTFLSFRCSKYNSHLAKRTLQLQKPI